MYRASFLYNNQLHMQLGLLWSFYYYLLFVDIIMCVSGCTNQFVKLEYDSAAFTITCTFSQSDNFENLSCDIRYGRCGQELSDSVPSTTTSTNTVTLNLRVSGAICYLVTASNGSYTVLVEGIIGN